MSSIADGLEQAERLLNEFRSNPDTLAALERFAELVADCFRDGGKVLACGNGGSLCDAMHFAEEFSGRFRRDRRPYPALALSDPAHLTCVANDYGYEHVFARQVEALASMGDIVVILSTSGASPSILQAAKAARQKEALVIGLVGRGGGELRSLCDLAVLAPGEGSDRIQELHMTALHLVIEAVEAKLGHA